MYGAIKHNKYISDENIWSFNEESLIGTVLGNKIIDNSDVVGASPVGTAPTVYSFST